MERIKQILRIIWLVIWSVPELISAFIVSLLVQTFYYLYNVKQISIYNEILVSIPISIAFLLLSIASFIHMGILKAKYLRGYRQRIEAFKTNII